MLEGLGACTSDFKYLSPDLPGKVIDIILTIIF